MDFIHDIYCSKGSIIWKVSSKWKLIQCLVSEGFSKSRFGQDKLLNYYCDSPKSLEHHLKSCSVTYSCKTLPRFCPLTWRVVLVNTRDWLNSKSYTVIRTVTTLWSQHEEGCSEAQLFSTSSKREHTMHHPSSCKQRGVTAAKKKP